MTDWTDIFGDLTIAQAMLWIAAAGALITLVVKLWKPLKAFIDFLDDVKGEPGHPGVPARPGLMERMSAIETSQTAIEGKVDAMSTSLSQVRHEVLPNTGTSLRDAADRTETKVDALAEDMATVHKKLDNDNRRIEEIATRLPEEGQ